MSKSAKKNDEKEEKPVKNGSSIGIGFVVIVALLGISLGLMYQNPKAKQSFVRFFPEPFVRQIQDATGLNLLPVSFNDKRVLKNENTKPETPRSFTIHFNGDGVSESSVLSTTQFSGVNDLLKTHCPGFLEVRTMGGDNPVVIQRLCDGNQGARLFTQSGIRVFSLEDIEENDRVYVVPQGVHFVWPLGKVGSYVYPKNVESPIQGKPIRMKQLSMSPRVFTIENFMSQEEMNAIIEQNKDLVKPSEVGFAGWRDSTRTSSTAWDFHSWAAKKIQRRAFDITALDFDIELADATQVLRYENNEWYKPHTDWFDEKGYHGHDPTVNNGTNRFATVFLYLTDVPQGGHTVFPLSRTHEGYNGEYLVHKGTENTPGYIANNDAKWVCNTSSAALRSAPVAGSAVLFYSQGPDGSLDKFSLHGGCPVIEGTKWSANVWLWNRPKPGKEDALDGEVKENDSIQVQFKNTKPFPIELYWDDGSDEMIFQQVIAPDEHSPMSTYHGHRFVAKEESTKKEIGSFTANDNMKDQDHIHEF